MKRKNTGYEDDKWSVVSGKLDGNETVIDAAIREAKEEVGITVSPSDVRVIGVTQRKEMTEWIDFYVTLNTWEGEVTNVEEDKCEQLAWFNQEELPEGMIEHVRQALEQNRDSMWFRTYGTFK